MTRKSKNLLQDELFSPIPENDVEKAEQQIIAEHKIVDYDVHEYPLDVLVQKYVQGKDDDTNELFIPTYQRKFVWELDRQSKFIESLLLGLPIPYLFTADSDGRLEIVDGSQRLRTLEAFFKNELVLEGLEKLTELNGFRFKDLLLSRQRRFSRKSVRLIALTEKADWEVRKDLFGRINTTSTLLEDMELRKGMFEGKFYDFIKECSRNVKFKLLCPISEKREAREEREEFVLRFFAYSDKYKNFVHSVKNFLNDFMKEKQKSFTGKVADDMRVQFENMLDFVDKHFPNGFRKSPDAISTPRVRFEAISVGVHLALQKEPDLIPNNVREWLYVEPFLTWTKTDAANNKSNLVGRIEFVRDKLLEKNDKRQTGLPREMRRDKSLF